MLGFIFYPKSKRYVGEELNTLLLAALPESIKKIGVFVNDNISEVIQKVRQYNLYGVQLHGTDNAVYTSILKSLNIIIIKSLPIKDISSFKDVKLYEDTIDYFLFDTPTNTYGGSGQVFDWHLLNYYNSHIPFFLSGGLGTHNIHDILKFDHPQLAGFDANSKLELEPALKDISQTKKM